MSSRSEPEAVLQISQQTTDRKQPPSEQPEQRKAERADAKQGQRQDFGPIPPLLSADDDLIDDPPESADEKEHETDGNGRKIQHHATNRVEPLKVFIQPSDTDVLAAVGARTTTSP